MEPPLASHPRHSHAALPLFEMADLSVVERMQAARASHFRPRLRLPGSGQRASLSEAEEMRSASPPPPTHSKARLKREQIEREAVARHARQLARRNRLRVLPPEENRARALAAALCEITRRSQPAALRDELARDAARDAARALGGGGGRLEHAESAERLRAKSDDRRERNRREWESTKARYSTAHAEPAVLAAREAAAARRGVAEEGEGAADEREGGGGRASRARREERGATPPARRGESTKGRRRMRVKAFRARGAAALAKQRSDATAEAAAPAAAAPQEGEAEVEDDTLAAWLDMILPPRVAEAPSPPLDGGSRNLRKQGTTQLRKFNSGEAGEGNPQLRKFYSNETPGVPSSGKAARSPLAATDSKSDLRERSEKQMKACHRYLIDHAEGDITQACLGPGAYPVTVDMAKVAVQQKMQLAHDSSGPFGYSFREPFAESWQRLRSNDGAQLFSLVWPTFSDRFPSPEMDLSPLCEVEIEPNKLLPTGTDIDDDQEDRLEKILATLCIAHFRSDSDGENMKSQAVIEAHRSPKAAAPIARTLLYAEVMSHNADIRKLGMPVMALNSGFQWLLHNKGAYRKETKEENPLATEGLGLLTEIGKSVASNQKERKEPKGRGVKGKVGEESEEQSLKPSWPGPPEEIRRRAEKVFSDLALPLEEQVAFSLKYMRERQEEALVEAVRLWEEAAEAFKDYRVASLKGDSDDEWLAYKRERCVLAADALLAIGDVATYKGQPLVEALIINRLEGASSSSFKSSLRLTSDF
ncbi:hypothetical protein AB1Y20_012105 [Prymnesium parvum]|uniref:Nuclear pore complex protein n=1 Tax=Prymnesium parvum TaxID=97485 RepID=A0AB34INF4_PRYPA